MKVGTLMDPNETRRGTRAFTFNPTTMGIEPLDRRGEEHGQRVNSDEPEPDEGSGQVFLTVRRLSPSA
jgi:hypothetical protein